MSSARWERMNELFHRASALAPPARADFLAAACPDDPALRQEVERLIGAGERAGGFIEIPVVSLGGGRASEESESSLEGLRCGAWRIGREIGRGGMGAVYLGERADGHYQQRVAIKLVKRGMDTDLVLHRFRAERQILASLDHANIARLLDGGTMDDGRPYFVMEYIEGQPIDRWADAHRLPIDARLRLFLQVCSAVAYAHRHLVVHRDIKPVNILVTGGGVPKLLDFGIAKVFDPDVDEMTSSVTGFRLLTPEYASPEQVEGRHATAVSDVYSLGVVLYELLTGCSPYRLRSRGPLDVAQAVRTIEPEAPSTAVTRTGERGIEPPRRPGLEGDRVIATGAGSAEKLRRHLRGDLDTIALTALRKEPSRRYQSVEQLADDIQRHLDGRPVRARPDTVPYRAGKFLRRNRTAALAAALAGIAVLLVGGAIVTLRSGEPGDDATSGSGVLAARDRVLVADFADRAGDPVLVSALSDAFKVDLAQSRFVQVLTPRQVRSALTRMERSPDIAIDDSLARELAVREGVKAFVTGSVSHVAGTYAISAQLVSVSGDLLVAARESARDSTDVIRAVDRLSERLRRRMGESLRSVRSTPPLGQVTTSSLAALRLYTQATRLGVTGDREQSVVLLRRAIALDTGFASAWRVLGVTYGDMVEYGRQQNALEHAIANQHRLPFYERYHTLATYAYNTLGDYPAAIEAYRRILERYPDDVRALNNLGYVYGLQRRYAAQESMLVRAYAADSTIPTILTGLAMARLHEGDFAGAQRAIDSALAQVNGLHQARLGKIYLAAARQDWPAAEREARSRLLRTTALDSLDGLETLAGIVLTQGRMAEGERYSRTVMAMSPKLGSLGRFYSSAIRLARAELRYHHDTAQAIAEIDGAFARFPLDSIREGDRPYTDLALLLASTGRPRRARELLDAEQRTRLGQLRKLSADRDWARGVITLAEGRARDAVPELQRAQDESACPICVLPDLARAYDALGMRDSAIAVYERFTTLPWQWRFETDDVELGWALLRLGELYDARGDRARAVRAYDRLLQLWRSADPPLQRVLGDVRERVARESHGVTLLTRGP